ncbi:MAG: hypothetical protein JO127_05450 [Caulobacteraceae bacterium]|nr:hypothetical protein [Caulobacteraceae bacterium]
MKTAAALALTTLALALGAAAEPRAPHRPPIASAALIAAAKAAPLKQIDYLETYCDGDVSVEAWLEALTAGARRSIAWSAGRCELVNELNPLDAGGDYCVQASVGLRRRLNRDDVPEIEIYLENPKHGRPGAVYAFRAVLETPDGDPDYIRARKDFEAGWRERFPGGAQPPCRDDQ